MTQTSFRVDLMEPPCPDPAAGVCRELRHATHAAHVPINRHSDLSGLLKAGFPLAKYQTLLAMQTALYAAIETQFESFIAGDDGPFAYFNRRKPP